MPLLLRLVVSTANVLEASDNSSSGSWDTSSFHKTLSRPQALEDNLARARCTAGDAHPNIIVCPVQVVQLAVFLLTKLKRVFALTC